MADKAITEVKARPARARYGNPRTPEEAKEEFRVAASRLSLGQAIQRSPWKYLGIAIGAGFALGYSRVLRQSVVGLSVVSLRSAAAVMAQFMRSPHAEQKSIDRSERCRAETVPDGHGSHGRKS